jgi:hypothetical protein
MLDKFNKNLLGFIFQYLQGREVIKCEGVSKKVSAGAKQDYIWRFLSEKQLTFMRKQFKDSWKQAFWRNFLAQDNMTPDHLTHLKYQMCPVRHFKRVIKFVESYHNFIMAADESGAVGIFLIDEADLENDNETLQTWETQTPGIVFFKFFSQTQTLCFVTTKGVF